MAITNTTLTTDDKSVILARRIGYHYIKIEFGIEVKAAELAIYFSLPDEHFTKLGVRK